jgi:hypothetical protein
MFGRYFLCELTNLYSKVANDANDDVVLFFKPMND